MTIESTPSEQLLPCHACGYPVPGVLGQVCPECGQLWEAQHDAQQRERKRVREGMKQARHKIMMVWAIILIVYALGGFVVSRFDFASLVGIFVSIGIGIVASIGVGSLISQRAPEHERIFYRWAWIRSLWWAHAPWLAIGPLTLIGSALGFAFRLTSPDMGEGIFFVVILPIFLGWIALILISAFFFSREYMKTLGMVGIKDSRGVKSLHSLWAFCVLCGSGVVGLGGGAMGVAFIEWVLTGHTEPFVF